MRKLFLLLNLVLFSLSAGAKPPNIVFFFTDDQRHDTLGCAGHPIVKTPNIDRLADRGVRFSNMFVGHSICWVSRTSILTGLTARSFGEKNRPDACKPSALKALYPDLLRQAGYRVGFFGKWHAKMPKGFQPEDHFDVFQKISRNPYFKEQPDGSLRHETELIGDGGVEFIKAQPKDKPFVLNLWFNASHAEDRDKRPGIGHFPWPKATDGMYEDLKMPEPRLNDPAIYESHPSFLKESINRQRFFWRWDTPEKYQINMRAYFRMLSGIDNVVGRVLQTLKEQGLADNTIIVYSADNGYYMGDRGFAGKWSHYEQSLRVPLIIFDPRPNAGPRGRVEKRMALNLDLPASFLAWAGLDVPDSYQGSSLTALVAGQPVERWRRHFFCEHVTLAPHITWEGVHTQRYKYARYFDQKPVYEFLFDLKNDPDELQNLAQDSEHRRLLARMRKRTDSWVKQYGGPLIPMEERIIRRKPKRK